MARTKAKRRKYTAPTSIIKWNPSKTYLEQAERVAKKIMQILAIDPALFDKFTKKQKLLLLRMEKALPSVRISPGSTVPRKYLEYIRGRFYEMIGLSLVDDNEEVRLTLMELMTYGPVFFGSVCIYSKEGVFPDEQRQILRLIFDRGKEFNLFSGERCSAIDTSLLTIMMCISQPQFRIYGYNVDWSTSTNRYLSIQILIHSHMPESTHVMYRGNLHKVYKIFLGGVNDKEPITATIDYQTIFPNQTNINNRTFTIYIQNHAIHRMKERLDVMYPIDRAQMTMSSLVINPEVRLGSDGQPMFCCRWNNTVLGYFPFFLQDDKAVISTFLSLSFAATSEGKQLQERLHLQIDDIKHLGMDKLQFYLYTDFDEIPELKQALIDTGIYNVVGVFERSQKVTQQEICTRTKMVKKYLGM
jgi:hypothetical protein